MVVLAILVVALTLVSAHFYLQYENQASISSNESQLLNGIPKSAAWNCDTSNFRDGNPSPFTFWPLLPSSLGNVSAPGIGLVTMWPEPLNSSVFLDYEVWNVTFFVNGDFQHLHSLDMVYVVDCKLG
jgi:hypothetical protein